MRFHQTTAKNATKLSHLATLLCALADLTERAAGRSGAVCLLVLWLIRPAEAVARDYVEKIAPGAARMPGPLHRLDGAGEALRLAHGLRLLAAILATLADECAALLEAAPLSRPLAGPAAPALAHVSPPANRQPCPP